MFTVTPAFGRDYKSAEDALADWIGGKDFLLRDPLSAWDGKPISNRDRKVEDVLIRYNKLTRVVTLPACNR